MMNLGKKLLAFMLCLTMALSISLPALAVSIDFIDFTVEEDLSEEERAQWEEWASEEEVKDMSMQAGAIELTPDTLFDISHARGFIDVCKPIAPVAE